MKQHAVPENIMDVEFKLFGSLTAKQFGYIIAGGCIALFWYFLFKSLDAVLLGWTFAVLSFLLGLALALVRINEQPFEIWLGNFISAMFSSQKRVWKKEKKVPESLKQVQKPVQQQNIAQQQPQQIQQQSVTTTQQSQTPQSPAVQNTFKGVGQQGGVQSSKIAGQSLEGDLQGVPGSAQQYVRMSRNQTPNRPITFSKKTDMNQNQSNLPSNVSRSQPAVKQDAQAKGDSGQDQPVTGALPQGDDAQGEQNISILKAENKDSNQPQQIQPQQNTNPVFLNKANQYNDMIPDKNQAVSQMQNQDSQTQPAVPTQGSTVDISDENTALRQKVAEFSEDKKRLETELGQAKNMYTNLQQQNQQIMAQLQNLRKEFESMQMKGMATATMQQKGVVGTDVTGKQEEGLLSPKVYDGPSLSRKPNVISGIVKTRDGKLLPGVVVIVKDPSKKPPRPVRAMRTNSLGQFLTTSSIEENGTYVIELSKDKFSFGRYEVKLTGDSLPTYEFIAG